MITGIHTIYAFFGSFLVIDKLGFHTVAKVAEGSHQMLIELHLSKHHHRFHGDFACMCPLRWLCNGFMLKQ